MMENFVPIMAFLLIVIFMVVSFFVYTKDK